MENDFSIKQAMETAVSQAESFDQSDYAAGDLVPIFRPNAQTGRDELVGKIPKSYFMQAAIASMKDLLRSANLGTNIDKVPTLNANNFGSTSIANLASVLGVDKRFEFIDMGLPSGTLWASKNLGADTITDYGAYFSWGNVQGQKPNGTTFPQTWGSGNDTEPYVSSEGAALSGDIPLNLDAANYYLGGKAKMPTKDQFVELFNSSYTTNEWTTLHGVAGRLVTSHANGNTVFFPAAGFGDGSSLYYAGSGGYYWSRSLQSSTNGYGLYFNSSGVNPQNSSYRYRGFSVRAVL